jgi:GWxTD domain-containing protein
MLVGVGSADAQSAHDRDQLAAFRDSLAAAPDNEALRALERALIVRVQRDRRNPALHLRLGLIALRLGDYSDAVSEFRWTSQLAPQWGSAWFGLAQAELALGEVADTSRLGRRAFLAKDAWERATVAFGRAVMAESSLAQVAETIVRSRLADDRAASARVVRDGLRRSVAGRTKTAEAYLSLGRVEASLGDTAAALAAFGNGAALPGGRGKGLVEAARLRLLRPGDPVAVESYLEAAAVDDSSSVAMLRADLAWIASAAELEAFDRCAGRDRAELLRDLWTRRDRAELRPTGMRLAEHYRRMAIAARTFRNQDDQRVAVWIRHGEPDNRATLRDPSLRPNESWRYRRAEGDLVVHFLAGADTTNYRVVESIYDLVGDRNGAPAGDDWEAAGGLADQVLRSRAQLSPFYQAAAAGRRDQLAAFRQRERELGRAGRNLALTSDRFPLRFERDLPARVQLGAFAGKGRRGVHVLFVIPAFVVDSAAPEEAGDGVVRVRLVVWDSLGGAAEALDTTIAVIASTRNNSALVRGQVFLPLPSGRYTGRVALELGKRGTIVGRDGIAVAGGGEPSLTDLAIGVVGSDLHWLIEVEPARIQADPGGLFNRTDTVEVSTGLQAFEPGTVVRVRAMVRLARNDGKEDKWRAWPGSGDWRPVLIGDDGTARATLQMPARRLKAGQYEIEVVAIDDRDREARQRGSFAVQ